MKHLTISDRLMIEQGIQSNLSFRTIAHKIKKSPSTISREVLSHRGKSTKGAVGRIKNCCIYRSYCNFYHICQGSRCRRKCSACYNCNANCYKFKEDICRKLSPYVCNGCNDEHKCVLNKMFYLHSVANKEYTQMLFNSRKGANLTENEKLYISNIIHAGIQKGQSVHHILASNKDFFNICEKTIYRYVNAGIIRTKRGDMPTQEDINLVVSHINSFSRKSLNDIPAITLFETLYGKEILPALNIKLIDSNLVCLMPELVKK